MSLLKKQKALFKNPELNNSHTVPSWTAAVSLVFLDGSVESACRWTAGTESLSSLLLVNQALHVLCRSSGTSTILFSLQTSQFPKRNSSVPPVQANICRVLDVGLQQQSKETSPLRWSSRRVAPPPLRCSLPLCGQTPGCSPVRRCGREDAVGCSARTRWGLRNLVSEKRRRQSGGSACPAGRAPALASSLPSAFRTSSCFSEPAGWREVRSILTKCAFIDCPEGLKHGATPHFVSNRGPDGFIEELDADDGQQADAHSQDDGEPQVRLTQRVWRSSCKHRGNNRYSRKDFSFSTSALNFTNVNETEKKTQIGKKKLK